jgi:hypothetical protein
MVFEDRFTEELHRVLGDLACTCRGLQQRGQSTQHVESLRDARVALREVLDRLAVGVLDAGHEESLRLWKNAVLALVRHVLAGTAMLNPPHGS